MNLFRAIFAPPRDLILPLVAAWIGMILTERRAMRTGANGAALDTLFGAMAIAFVAGGRLFFAASHLTAFTQSPASVVSLNTTLFDVWGAAACAGIAAVVVMQRKGLAFWDTLDLLAPFLATLAIGISLANLASGEGFGSETRLPWGIELWGARRHPTQIYEAVAGAITLGLIWLRGNSARPGQKFMTFVALTAASRLIIDAFRGDSVLVFGGLRVGQIAAWLVLATALAGLEFLGGSRNNGEAEGAIAKTEP